MEWGLVAICIAVVVWVVRDRLRVERVMRDEYDKREQKYLDRIMEPDYRTLKAVEHRTQRTENKAALDLKRVAKGQGDLVERKEEAFPMVGDM